MKTRLMSVIEQSGIWAGERASTHAITLSPDVYSISKDQKQELKRLGFALYDCLRGLSQMGVIASLNDRGSGKGWETIAKVFGSGTPARYRELIGLFAKDIPRVLKLDLMQNDKGEFKIAEIDGHNKHGMGYSTLGARFRKAIAPDAEALPGVVKLLAKEVERTGEGKIKLFYSDRERFYKPELEIVATELASHGIQAELFAESEATPEMLSSGLVTDMPFLFNNAGLYETLVPAYKAKKLRFVIPPKPFFGAKGVLAILRNDAKDEHIEAILRAFISPKSLALVRAYIPETLLVGRLAASKEEVLKRCADKRYVLKESVSSGMKGVIFSDEPLFEVALKKASAANMNWILQEEVANRSMRFSSFSRNSDEPVAEDGWFMRVTTHYVNHELADVIVTARRDRAVHGAPDCLQIGTIVS